jgi:hypothetical protein
MSIDRRSFVQSTAAALGGTAGFAAEATAQERLQLAQATAPTYLAPAISGGPYKPYDKAYVASVVQKYYDFLTKLFDSDINKGTLRNDIWSKNDMSLRMWIFDTFGYNLDYSQVRIMILDIQNGRVKFSDRLGCSGSGECSIDVRMDDPTKTLWYTLVLPPLPLDYPTKDTVGGTPVDSGYLHEVKWELAWHHAIAYATGM